MNWKKTKKTLPFNRSFSSFYRCYLLLNRCYLLLSRCYLLLNRCYLLLNRCYLLLSRCYLLLSCSYLLLSRCLQVMGDILRKTAVYSKFRVMDDQEWFTFAEMNHSVSWKPTCIPRSRLNVLKVGHSFESEPIIATQFSSA